MFPEKWFEFIAAAGTRAAQNQIKYEPEMGREILENSPNKRHDVNCVIKHSVNYNFPFFFFRRSLYRISNPTAPRPTASRNLSLYSNSLNLDILGFYNQGNNPSQVPRKFLMFPPTPAAADDARVTTPAWKFSNVRWYPIKCYGGVRSCCCRYQLRKVGGWMEKRRKSKYWFFVLRATNSTKL